MSLIKWRMGLEPYSISKFGPFLRLIRLCNFVQLDIKKASRLKHDLESQEREGANISSWALQPCSMHGDRWTRVGKSFCDKNYFHNFVRISERLSSRRTSYDDEIILADAAFLCFFQKTAPNSKSIGPFDIILLPS